MKFKTEAERDEALAALPTDPPAGVKVEKWLEELDAKMKEIEEAEVGDEEEEAIENAPVENNGEVEMLRMQHERQEAENQRIIQTDRQKIKNLEEQLELAKTKGKTDDSKGEIDKLRTEIDGIIEDLDKKDDPLDEDYIKKLKKHTILNYRLNGLIDKRNEEREKEHRAELKKLRNEQALKSEADEKKNTKKAYIKNIEDFRGNHPELQGIAYDVMDDEYADFSTRVASTYFGKEDLTDEDIEIAVQKYMDGTPILLEKLAMQKVKEPKGLKQYLLLSELNAMDKGFVLNKNTGEWKPYLNGSGKQVTFPGFDDVYEHWKKSKGIKAKELIEQQRMVEKNMMAAINKRADITELDTEHRREEIGEMSEDRALKIIEELKPELIAVYGRKNINHPYIIEANKALIKLGQPPITVDAL